MISDNVENIELEIKIVENTVRVRANFKLVFSSTDIENKLLMNDLVDDIVDEIEFAEIVRRNSDMIKRVPLENFVSLLVNGNDDGWLKIIRS